MDKNEKVIGIIKKVGYGCRDVGYSVLFFTVYVNECVASLQIMNGKKANKFIEAYGVYDVKDLNGKPVWVNDNGRMMTDLEPCIIGGK